MQPTLETMIDWARGAGAILREGYGKQHDITRKGRIDLVTEMDQASEVYLIERIHASFPDHSIDTEESGLLAGDNPACWYIDPLDGTTNYAHAVPIFVVSLAFAIKGQIVLGVVYDPMRDECFSAARGEGAWLNGAPIHVSATQEMQHSLLVTGFPYEPLPDGRDNLAQFSHFTRISQGVRRLGAAASDLCYVACGRFEGYWELTLRPWDFAAGALIVEEAGGRVTRTDGSPDILRPPYSIIAGNLPIHTQMLREFEKFV